MKRVLIFISAIIPALIFSSCSAPAPDNTETTAQASASDMQTQLEEMMKEQKFNGVVRVSKNGVVVCEAASVHNNPGGGELSVDDQFAVGSVTKQFTAACVMLLKEENKLSVDDTVDKYYPEYKYGDKITVKNLLTMRSGIRDYVNDPDSEEEFMNRYDADGSEEANRKATRDWIFSKELDFEPDSRYAYSNSNYFMLAEIVEKASGERYRDFLRERILAPLGMNDTGVAEELHDSDRLAPRDDSSGDFSELEIRGAAFGDGGIISTAADMDKWLTSLRENTILSAESFMEMTADYSPESKHYGYGVFVNNNGAVYHGGQVDTYVTMVFTVPSEGYNLSAFSNKNEFGKLETLASKVKALTR